MKIKTLITLLFQVLNIVGETIVLNAEQGIQKKNLTLNQQDFLYFVGE